MPNTYDFLKRQFKNPAPLPAFQPAQPSYTATPDLSSAIINDWNAPENSIPNMGVRQGNPIEDTLTPAVKQTQLNYITAIQKLQDQNKTPRMLLEEKIKNDWNNPDDASTEYGSIAGLDDNEPDYGKIKTINADIAGSGNNGYTDAAAKNDTGEPLSLKSSTINNTSPTDISNDDRLGEGIWSLKSDNAGRTILAWYLFGNGADFIANEGYFADYLKNNKGDPSAGIKPLKEQVKDIVLNEGRTLGLGEQKNIDITTSMAIENREDIIGYQYLHGTNADVGGFHITGTISKNDQGDTTYDLTYTWNDMIDPNFLYASDSKKAKYAKSIPGAKPTNYTLRINWHDRSIIKAKPNWLNWNRGWLAE